MPPILPNVAPCLLHLCPEECVEALYVHTYIWHCSPPDLEWATHEVQRMVRIEVARNPAGILGIRGYFKALQKDCKQMQQQPYAPHEEAPKWSVIGNSFHLPAIQAACAILAEGSNNCCCEDERLLLEFAALRSEIFGWVDFICKHFSVVGENPANINYRRSFVRVGRQLRAAIKSSLDEHGA